uniref:ShKT domain-containing protein n=1 Tax=Ditylenchus dipsaci TaxID=166011 RepID=A0A915DNH7_9BILA
MVVTTRRLSSISARVGSAAKEKFLGSTSSAVLSRVFAGPIRRRRAPDILDTYCATIGVKLDAPPVGPFHQNPFNPIGGLPNSNLPSVDRMCMGMFCSAAGGLASILDSTSCQDKAIPGRPSDCPNNKQLCNQPLYRDLMTMQCPRTCGRCGLRGSLTGAALQNANILGAGVSTPGCIDNVGLNGISECPQQRAKCTLGLYARFMAEECCVTCRAFNPPAPPLGLGLVTGGGAAPPLIPPPGLRLPTQQPFTNSQTRLPGFEARKENGAPLCPPNFRFFQPPNGCCGKRRMLERHKTTKYMGRICVTAAEAALTVDTDEALTLKPVQIQPNTANAISLLQANSSEAAYVPVGIDLNDCLAPLQLDAKNLHRLSCINHSPHYTFIKSLELCCRRLPKTRVPKSSYSSDEDQDEVDLKSLPANRNVTSSQKTILVGPSGVPLAPNGAKILYCTPARFRRHRMVCPRSHPYDHKRKLCCGVKPIKSILPYTTATAMTKVSEKVSKKTNKTVFLDLSECVDLSFGGKPSDCIANARHCNDSAWYSLMTEQCAKTCGRCLERALNKQRAMQHNRIGFSSLVNTVTAVCNDGVGEKGQSECVSYEFRCNLPLWNTFMSVECPSTCKVCATAGS